MHCVPVRITSASTQFGYGLVKDMVPPCTSPAALALHNDPQASTQGVGGRFSHSLSWIPDCDPNVLKDFTHMHVNQRWRIFREFCKYEASCKAPMPSLTSRYLHLLSKHVQAEAQLGFHEICRKAAT
jgi:hypothetical protein